jgi:DNA transposition AAA+ family ATPase
MHVKFVRTTNVRNFQAAYDRLEQRGSREASWLATSGQPGLGKTKTVQWFAVEQDAVYVRGKANWSVRWMLQEIAEEYSLESGGSIKELFAQVLGRMATVQKPLVIDEARNLLHDAKLLETLRDLTDVTECPLILSGEDFVLKRLTTRYPQIRSRISETVDFRPASIEDVALICREICEVQVTGDVVAAIYRQSSGHVREIKNAIGAVERLATLQDIDLVEEKHVAGKRLCQDRNEVRARANV